MSGGFRCILVDPPWNETGGGISKRGADRHYALLKTPEIVPTIKASGLWYPANDAHLYLYSTGTRLPDAIQVGRDLGFEYKTNIAWVKMRDPREELVTLATLCARLLKGEATSLSDAFQVAADRCKPQMGLGQYVRGSHELLLFFTRGKGQSSDVWTGARDVLSTMLEPRTVHSAKPRAGYDLIERVTKGPRLEMFARCGRPGWVSWGTENG